MKRLLLIFLPFSLVFGQSKFETGKNEVVFEKNVFEKTAVVAAAGGGSTLIENIFPSRLIQYWAADYTATQRSWTNNTSMDTLTIKAGSRTIGYVPNDISGDDPVYQTNVEGTKGALFFDGADDIREFPTTALPNGFRFLFFEDSTFTIGMILKIQGADPNKFFWIWDNLGASFNGFAVRYDDRAASGMSNAIFLRIKDGNESWISSEWQQDIITPEVTHCLVFQWTGSGGVDCYVDSDTKVATYPINTPLVSPAWADANSLMHHGNTGWGGGVNPYEGWLFEFFVWDVGSVSITDIMNYFSSEY